MKIYSLILLVFLAPSVSAKGIDQQFRKQQSERERVLEVCKKQYKEARFWSSGVDVKSQLRFMITSNGVQSILPEVEQQDSGKYKCIRPVYEIPVKIGVELKFPCVPVKLPSWPGSRRLGVDLSVQMRAQALVRIHKPAATLRCIDTSTYVLKIESCSFAGLSRSSDSVKSSCLVEYKKSTGGKISRFIKALEAEEAERLHLYSALQPLNDFLDEYFKKNQ
jgi:hypothetical protein